MGCIALVGCVLVLRSGLAGVVWYNSQAPEDGCINIRNMLSVK